MGLAVGSPNDSLAGGFIAINTNVGIMDTGTGAAINVKRGGQLEVFDTLWGSGNLGKGTVVRDRGRVFVHANVTPTLASTGQELELEGSATAVQCVAQVPGTVAVPLVSWADWAAAIVAGVSGFAGNVLDYASGSTICTHD